MEGASNENFSLIGSQNPGFYTRAITVLTEPDIHNLVSEYVK